MGVVRFRSWRWIRGHLFGVLALALVIAAVGAAVIAVAAGAQRTSSAPDRYSARFDAGVDAIARQEVGWPRDDDLRALPGVTRVETMSFVFGGVADARSGEFVDAIVFAGSPRGVNGRLVEGREPAAVGEFIATREYVDATQSALGAQVTLFALTQEDAGTHGFDPSYARPILVGELVGVIESASSLDDPTAFIAFQRALLDTADVGISGSVMAIDLADGVSVDDLRHQVGRLANPEDLAIDPAAIVSSESRTAVTAQGTGLWTLAALGMLAGIAALGQLVVRMVRLDPDERAILAALGYTRGMAVSETVARAVPTVFGGATVAVVAAIAVSGSFPFGFVRRLEPSPGVRVDLVPLLGAWAVLTIGLLAWVAIGSALRDGSRGASSHGVIDRLGARCSATVTAGLRVVFDGRRRASTTVAIAAGALLVAAFAGALTFAASTRSMVRDPARYGATADLFHDDGADQVEPDLLDAFASHPGVDGLTLYRATRADVANAQVALIGMRPVRGEVLPHVVAGRLPADSDEIAVGNRTAAELGVSIGDDLIVSASGRTMTFEITGTVNPPSVRGNDVIGRGLVATWSGFDRFDPTVPPQAAAVDLAPGDPTTQTRVVTELGLDPLAQGTASRPGSIVNVARITFVPFALAALLALLVVVLLLNFTFTTVRRGDYEVGILRSIGADGGWLARATAWAGAFSAAGPLVVGLPIGILVGRLAYAAFADHLWITPVVEIPGLELALVGGVIVVGSVGVALAAGRRARRTRAADLLRGSANARHGASMAAR